MNLITYIVTLNWNTTRLLKEMALSVQRTTPECHKWIIVDNGSKQDDWRELELWTQICGLHNSRHGLLHRYEENQGMIIGHNQAFDLAAQCGQPHEIVMIDTDVTVFEHGWLSKVRAWADQHPEVGIVGLEHARHEKRAPAIFLDPAGYWYIHEDQPAEPTEGESVGLGMALIRWPVLEACLRFDPDFHIYYKQDDDLCFQVRADLGLEVWAFPIGCNHWGSGSLKSSDYQCAGCSGKSEFDELKRRNQEYFVEKWGWALRGRRGTLTEEAQHLAETKQDMRERRGG